MAQSRGIILALDTPSKEQALAWVDTFLPHTPYFKVGLELFSSHGPQIVGAIQDKGGKVFLDLKFHDIPSTVFHACEAAAKLGVWMCNVHAAGGREMLDAARVGIQAISDKHRPLLIAVTVLTSQAGSEEVEERVVSYAQDARSSGCDGVVCSAHEANLVQQACGDDFMIVTPGIRLPTQTTEDQARVSYPRQAFQAGAHFIVMGRSIMQASDPEAMMLEVRRDMMTKV